MLKHKRQRDKGKFSFTRFFQKFSPGDKVAVVRELSQTFGYSKRLQGRTGVVLEKRGAAYHIEIADLGKKKKYLIRPIHLKKIYSGEAK
ncbi:50S ribosomal protein L21e [Candidatus Pacearchaeota archaeon]|nr:50S ribosomal protein L21e [Candidatus Pacearchaeota archaeon]|tara:strand:- start:937 stop:1203 length:267 start_codon:yes stop_codon:yes gene_type:complete